MQIFAWGGVFSQTGAEMTYEILCKTFDVEAKAILEEGTHLGAET
jgi:hypothetical protein